jgi:Trypsin
VLVAMVCAVTLVLVPAAGASSGMPMSPVITKVRFHRGRISAGDLRHSLRARSAIVGGSRISIAQAPWQVLVIAGLPEHKALLCGGTILNEVEVLTAGHCVYNPKTREQIPAAQIVVLAGTADLEAKEPEEQLSGASEVRVHPYFLYNPEATRAVPDDVAVVKLNTPLIFDADSQAISLMSAGGVLQEGTSVNLTGFGEEAPPEGLDGELHSIGMTLTFSRQCGGEADALFLCASTPGGSDCLGDSGSGLTVPGSSATLVGVTDTVEVIEGRPCLDGALGGFANVSAPEIRDFIVEHDMAPPQAPRGGGVSLRGVPSVGNALTCAPGFWSNGPNFTYMFIDSANSQVLQQGSSSMYALGGTDVGRTIVCQVLASNEGGTGLARTTATTPVQRTPAEEEAAANKGHEEEAAAVAAKKRQEEEAKGAVLAAKAEAPDATIASPFLTVSSSGALVVKVRCPAGETSCTGAITLRTLRAVSASLSGRDAKHKAAVLTLAVGSFTVPGGQSKAVALHVSAAARKLLARSHVLSARATIVAHDPTGATHTGHMIVTLHASRTHHGKG